MVKTHRQNDLAVFFGLLILLTTVVFLWMFGPGGKSELTVAAMMWVPGAAALLALAIGRVSPGTLGWRVGGLGNWALALALPILVALIAYGSMWLSGVLRFYPDEVTNYRWIRMLGFQTPAPFYLGVISKGALASLMAVPFVLGEEIGWSGFLVPRLRTTFSISTTSIIVGLSWSVWHYPAIIGGIYGTGAPLWIALPGFTMALTGLSFFRTILVSRSGSLWPGVILHVSHNVFLMAMFYEMTRKSEHSSWLVSESGLFLGAVYLACGLLCHHVFRVRTGAGAPRPGSAD
jgi:membrane protease YdiL (CAAX protease family)